MNNALKAKELFKKDKDYVIMDGEILIVDEHTGRILSGRRYNEGLHQAIEAKEGVEIQAENQTLATITLQNFFRLYDKLGGMTGTAMTEAAEFSQIYKLGVVPIPTNEPNIRADQPDLVYRSEEAKYGAVIEDIVECNEKGQPVLVGTVSVEKSELLAKALRKANVKHEVLNAKFHDSEAAIIAEAGRKGAVTVATNMAGRGTDIMLGGNPEFRATVELTALGLSPVETPEEYEAAWPDALAKAEESVAAEHDEVTELGGLYVLGTERHESRRIDNQLRGRSGRQGDPGETRFYLSLQDELMRRFNAAMVEAFLARFNVPDDVPIEAKMVTRAIASAQGQVEAQNFEIRKNVLKYDEVMNRQRLVIYKERHRVLEGENLEDEVRTFMDDAVETAIKAETSEGFPEEWDLEQLWVQLGTIYPINLTVNNLEDRSGGGRSGLSPEFLVEEIQEDVQQAYDTRQADLGEEVTRELERRIILSVLDRKWREHLYEMDYLQEGIGLRAMAQRDPLIEYQKEGYDLFQGMMGTIKEESVGYLFNVDVSVNQELEGEPEKISNKVGAGAAIAQNHPQVEAKGLAPARPAVLEYSAPSEDADGSVTKTAAAANPNVSERDREYAGTARNANCPCGSGRKYKRCHGKAS
ncbi:MAG: preprotein translocase subunit SecA [Actinomycetes bacterium]